ncbi:MAG TPA: NAD-dependent epimerase/dehydratase family protein [Bacteroidia bacterium]|nr:NAD-dependent epimerase/dehydratase family protein [Bacteroidia bacterium]
MEEPLRVIITGTTGMVGEGVLHECLNSQLIEAVLIVNRKPLGITHPKLKEIIHSDFFDLTAIENQLTGYNACFFCLGISSVGVSADEYYKITYTLTLNWGQVLSKVNNNMTFSYISGANTDSTEKGRSRWARVKGKTENDLMKLPFKQVFGVRPGFIKPTQGLSNAHSFYKYVNWMYPIGRALFQGGFCTLKELGHAMINSAYKGYSKNIIEGKDIIELAK